MSEQKKVCRCGDFKDQHGNFKAQSILVGQIGLSRCKNYTFSHYEEVLTKREFDEEKKKVGFKLTRKII